MQKHEHPEPDFGLARAFDDAGDDILRDRGLREYREAIGGPRSVYALQNTSTSIVRSVIARPLELQAKQSAEDRKLYRTATRWGRCRFARISRDVTTVHVVDRATSYYRGLETCGSYSACPCCARIIQQRRRAELGPALDRWTGGGGGVLMLTLTVPHDFSQGIRELMDAFNEASQALWRGKSRTTMATKFGYRGRVRAWEVTRGANGWHPHQHILLFFESTLTAEQRAELQAWFVERWANLVAKSGLLGSRPSAARMKAVRSHGVDLRDGSKGASYLAKALPLASSDWGVAAEMTMTQAKSGRKGSKTWVELLQAVQAGDREAARAWAEYAVGFRGVRCLTWSRGLRELLGVGLEVDDEELAKDGQAEAGEVLGLVFTPELWRVVQRAERQTGSGRSVRGDLLADHTVMQGDSSLAAQRMSALVAAHGSLVQRQALAPPTSTFRSPEPELLQHEAPAGLGLDRRR